MAQSRRQQSTTNYPISILLDAAGLTPTIQISKNGGAFSAAVGAITETGGAGNGKRFYDWAGNAGDRDTLGSLKVVVSAAGSADFAGVFEIVTFDPFSPTFVESVTFKVS